MIGYLSFLSAVVLSLAAGTALSQDRQYNLTGVTVYDPAEILGFAAQLTAQRQGSVTPRALADTIEVIYREDGYFLAEVFVGSDGQTLVVDEGEIGSLSIEGVDAATFRRIRSYMAPVVGRRAVTQREFERAMMLVEDMQSISVRQRSITRLATAPPRCELSRNPKTMLLDMSRLTILRGNSAMRSSCPSGSNF